MSWRAIGIRGESFGLDPASVLAPSRLLMYGSQSLLVAGLAFWLTATRLSAESLGRLALLCAAAWVGEGLVLTAIGEPLVANELDPPIAWYFWIVATGGPLQPAAAFAGAWLRLGLGRDRLDS